MVLVMNFVRIGLFICVCFSDRDCKRYEGGDSNCTIYFEQPYSTLQFSYTSGYNDMCNKALSPQLHV